MQPQRIADLLAAKGRQADAARPDAVARVRAGGKLTARERMVALLDPGSEVEYGSIAAQTVEGEWVAEAGGVDFVGTIDGQVVVASSTDYTDHGGGYGAGRLPRLFALCQEHRWPVVFFVDGGGSRARHPRVGMGHIETSGPFGQYTLFDGMAELSGWVPTVAIVSGPAFAGHASLAGFSDVVIATGGSSIGMGGPPMVEAALGKRLTPNELAGVEMHELTGGIDLLVADEHEAMAVARRYLGYWRDHSSGAPSSTADAIADLVADDGPYDVRPVIEALVDEASVLELRPAFAPALVTALARLDGRSVGIIANQPLVDDGRIDTDAATKIGRFVELCDAYELPIVSLVDTPGCVVTFPAPRGSEEGPAVEVAVNRWHTRVLLAHHHRTVPLFTVRLRRGGGLGAALMGGLNTARATPVLSLAWPSAEVRTADGFAAVVDHNAFDDVVVPAETRERIVRLLRHLPRRLDQREKKHPVDTW